MNVYEEPVVYKNLPKLDELLCIVVSLNSAEKVDSTAKTDFQWQLLKTRILIFSDENVIACPMANTTKYLNIICKKEYYTSGCFSVVATKHLLKVDRISRPSLEIYKECLVYNIICKVSPGWNKVEKYFIMDKYFLLTRGVLNAITLNLRLTDEDLLVYCQPKRLWLTPLDILEFDIPVTCLQHMASRKFYIDLSSNPFWVCVLPSFRRGRAVYVTNRLPENCLFKDYKQMRRHWKNTYGFRLPEEDSQMIYVGVNFFGNQDFTYPLICVRKGLHENDGHPILKEQFVKCLTAKMANNLFGGKLDLQNPSVCNNDFSFKVVPAEKWSENNLLEIDKRLVANFVHPPSLQSAHTSRSESSNEAPENEVQVNEKLITPSDSEWFEKCSTFINGLSQTKPGRSYLPVGSANKPIFNKRPNKFCGSVIRLPIFLDDPRLSQSLNESSSQTATPVGTQVTNSETNTVLYKPFFTAKKPIFKGQRSPHPKIEKNCGNENANPENEEKTLINPIFNRKPLISKPKESNIPVSLMDQNMNAVYLNKPEGVVVSYLPVQINLADLEKVKESSEKKKKPHLSTDSEIVQLFKCGSLSRVNAPSLYKFLKRHGVACLAKDKKNELVIKAEDFLKSKAL